MTSRITGYGVGAAKIDLAPVPQKSNGVPTSSTAYDFGQLVYNTATGTWYAYSGGSTYIPLGGGTTSGILSINGIFPAVGGDFTLAAGTGITLTPGTNTITIGLTGGGVAIDSFVPDAGTNPVVPTAAGAVTMAGTANQITTTGGLNTLTFSVPSAFIAPGSVTVTSGFSVLAGTSSLLGTVNINNSGAGVTTIGTGGTGAVNIGNATGNTSVTGSLTATTTLTASLGAITATNGNLVLGTAGNKISIATGANATVGTSGAMTAGAVTVANTSVTANSLIFAYPAALGTVTVPQAYYISTITPATSFVITSQDATDTSTWHYLIIN